MEVRLGCRSGGYGGKFRPRCIPDASDFFHGPHARTVTIYVSPLKFPLSQAHGFRWMARLQLACHCLACRGFRIRKSPETLRA